MNTVDEIMRTAFMNGACSKSGGVSDWRSLVWLFFSPQGREFCEKNNFPSLSMFRDMKENVIKYGVYVDSGKIECSNDTNIGLVGETDARLVFDDNTKVHKVVLMHGAKAVIKASNYAVLLVINVGDCDVQIDKDETVVIL